MIIFATNHDTATEGGYVVARLMPHRVLPQGTILLFGEDARREPLKEALNSLPDKLLLVFSHGKTSYLVGQGGDPAIDLTDGPTIGPRVVFAYACWTADMLGPDIVKHGAIWWGFTGEIAALPTDIRSARIISKLFIEILVSVPLANTVNRVTQYVSRIKTVCDAVRSDLRALNATGHRVDPYAYYCIEHIAQRLRVWLPGEGLPIYDVTTRAPVSVMEV